MRRFTIFDLLVVTALIAINLAASSAAGRSGGSDWAAIAYLTPTVITCLIHLRLRLRITVATAVHYLVTAAWTFLHAVGVNYAINANRSGSNPRQVLIYTNAWNDTAEMLVWGIILAATYGGVCYTAVAASNVTGSLPSSPDMKSGEPSDAPESPNRAF